ncbi:hypothetical protein ACTFIY_001305 [Dictyostelium cf. discoideum]
MKIILTLSIFLICFLHLGQSVIDPSHNEVTSDLLFNLYGYDIKSTSTFQTVIDLNLGEPLQEYVITQDLTIVWSLNATIPGDTIFPASLETFTIYNPLVPLIRAIFESTILLKT